MRIPWPSAGVTYSNQCPVVGASRRCTCAVGPSSRYNDGTHQTSPTVKLGDLFHFTNSHPYEAILGAIDASWGVLSRKKFRRWLKKIFGKKMTREVEFWGTPHFFYEILFFRPSLNCSRQRQPKWPQNPPGLASIAAAVLWQRYLNSAQFAHSCGS